MAEDGGIDPTWVVVILDPTFGPQVRDHLGRHPVWIVLSPGNEPHAAATWRERPDAPALHLSGLPHTPGQSEQDHLLRSLEVIDIHHGPDEGLPPCTALQVIGCEPNDELEAVLHEAGFSLIEPTADGFVARCRRQHWSELWPRPL